MYIYTYNISYNICMYIHIQYIYITPEMTTYARVTSLATRILNKCFVRANQSLPAFPL